MARRYINTRKTRRYINNRAIRSKTTRPRTHRRHHTHRKKHTGGGGNTEITTMLNTHMQQRRGTNLSNVLKSVCKNSDSCIALGQYDTLLRTFFEEFKNLAYIDRAHTKRIGTPSNNGFIIEIPFKKDEYTAYTVLKCSSKRDADNLLYEYFVGKYFINRYLKKLPCFVETYDLYEFKTEQLYKSAKYTYTHRAVPNYNIIDSINRVDINLDDLASVFNHSCASNARLCVLIQHFDRFTPLFNAWKNNYDATKRDVYNIYYQVYYALCILGDSYTHYDLHANNIALYRPFDEKQYILMRYHRGQTVYEFKSEYIAKIIDYGRNYFNDGVLSTPEIIKDYVCTSSACEPDCGEEVGYANIHGSIADPESFDFYWIDPSKPNISHDLRAAHDLLGSDNPSIKLTYVHAFGTPERTDVAPKNSPVVQNIFDMRRRLEEIIPSYNKVSVSQKYDSTWKHAATMDVYDDGREYTMQYV